MKEFIDNLIGSVSEKEEAWVIDKDGNGKLFKNTALSLKEMQSTVGGCIEIVSITDDVIMVMNDEGKIEGLSINRIATEIYHRFISSDDFICGNVIISNTNLVE